MTTQSRLDKILPKIQAPDFLENKGRSNEIGFFVFDYLPEDEIVVRDHVTFLVKQLKSPVTAINVVEIDLYDLMLEMLDARGLLDKIDTEETRHGFEKVIDKLKRGILKSGNIVRHIQSKISDDTNLVFLTGVGKAYPILRSHTVLNNLHHTLNQMTVIIFFPGIYDQRQLQLFGKFKDDNYYRAFRLIED